LSGWLLSESSICTSKARSSIAVVNCSTGVIATAGSVNSARPSLAGSRREPRFQSGDRRKLYQAALDASNRFVTDTPDEHVLHRDHVLDEDISIPSNGSGQPTGAKCKLMGITR